MNSLPTPLVVLQPPEVIAAAAYVLTRLVMNQIPCEQSLSTLDNWRGHFGMSPEMVRDRDDVQGKLMDIDDILTMLNRQTFGAQRMANRRVEMLKLFAICFFRHPLCSEALLWITRHVGDKTPLATSIRAVRRFPYIVILSSSRN